MLELENRGQALLTRTADMPEALAAFREKRPVSSPAADAALNPLARKQPGGERRAGRHGGQSPR